MAGVKITGMGICLPKTVLDNQRLSHELEARILLLRDQGLIHGDMETIRKKYLTSPEWIKEREIGIEERRIIPASAATSDLAVIAAEGALAMSGLSKKMVESVLLASVTPDYRFSPPTTSVIQEKLGLPVRTKEGLRNFFFSDISAACSSFPVALYNAYALIRSGLRQNVVLIGADKMSSATNWYDRQTCILLADGAFACVLEATEGPDWFDPNWFFFGTDGSLADRIMTKKGGSASPLEKGDLDNPLLREDKIAMQGNKVFKEITRILPEEVIPQAIKKSGLTLDQIKLMVFHQANLRMIDKVVQDLGYEGEVYNNISTYGNTTSASIGIALYEAWQKGLVKSGDYVMLVAFGGGYTWGVVILKYWGLNVLDIPLPEEETEELSAK